MIKSKCEFCGVEFEQTGTSPNGDKYIKKCCSRKCSSALSRKYIDHSSLKIAVCVSCNKEIHIKSQASIHSCLCSDCCSKNANRDRNRKRIVKEHNNSCLCCGSPITGRKCFCDLECFQNFRFKTKWDKFEDTGSFEGSTNPSIRKYLIHKHGNKCSVCGVETWMGKEIVMIVDHIDGNSDNTKIENFRLVCPMCDSQLPTFKGRNRGKGRHNRRQRYANGMSY